MCFSWLCDLLWWVDSGATYTHKYVVAGLPVESTAKSRWKIHLCGRWQKIALEAIGTFRIQLKIGFLLDLFETFFVHSFIWNLISISRLYKFGFSCWNNKVSLYQNSNIIGSGSLINNLYLLDVVNSYNEILQTSPHGTKQKLNENWATLWHKRLSHISK